MTATEPRKPDLVKIEWKSIDIGEWPYFLLLETLPNGWLKLKGVDYPDGSAKHRGDTILVHRADISSIEVVG